MFKQIIYFAFQKTIGNSFIKNIEVYLFCHFDVISCHQYFFYFVRSERREPAQKLLG